MGEFLIKIVEMEFGSRVYGTNTPTSDLDFKAVSIPDHKDIILQRAFRSINKSTSTDNVKNTAEDVDHETFSLHYFIKLLIEGQTVCLDMLFTPDSFYKTERNEVWDTLRANKDKLLSKEMSAFAGYCQAQAAKYSLKGSNLHAFETGMLFFERYNQQSRVGASDMSKLLEQLASEDLKSLNGKAKPLAQIVQIANNKGVLEDYIQIGPKTKIPFHATCKTAYEIMKHQYDRYGERAKMAKTNQGIDWKALMHAVRVCNEAIELCKTGAITFPRPEKSLLLQIRKGELPYEFVADEIESGLLKLNEVKAASSLPEKPDIKWLEDYVYSVYAKT